MLLTDGGSDASHRARPRDIPGHGGCLSRGCRLGRRCLLLHLPVALTQVKHLHVGPRVDLVNCVSRGSPRLPVQVVALYEHCMVAKATHPHIPLTTTLQLHPLPNVQPVKWRWEFTLVKRKSQTLGIVFISIQAINTFSLCILHPNKVLQ